VEQNDDIVSLWLAAKRMTALLEQHAETELRSQLGLSLSTYALLTTLQSANDGVNQQEVARFLGLAKSSVSRQIEAAAAAGLLVVSPSPLSRRENTVVLTAAGARLATAADDIVCAIGPAEAAPEIAAASSALQRVLGTLGASEGAASPSA